MAQLRDVKTSEILVEGSPLEVALVAQKVGRDEILYDDVGEGFDPDAVISAHNESIGLLEQNAKGKTATKGAREALAAAQDEADVSQATSDAIQALEGARARVEA